MIQGVNKADQYLSCK